MVSKSAFSSPPVSSINEPIVQTKVIHKMVTQYIVQQALMTQSMSKAPRPNKINFRSLRMIWEWNSRRFITMIKHSIRLGYQPKR